MFKAFGHFPHLPRMARLLLIIFFVIISFGILIHLIEPSTFPHIFDGIWWAIITTSTIGYGDFVPHSITGRMAALLLILIGVGLVTSYFANIAALAASSEQAYQTGKTSYNHSGHIIIVGWNERTRAIIRAFEEMKDVPDIVLIDDSLTTHPLANGPIHFIQGNAAVDKVLLRANIRHAAKVLITAEFKQDEFQTDMFSILTLLAVKGLNSDVVCLIEVLTKEQVANAYRAGADEVIETNIHASSWMLAHLLDSEEFRINGEWNIVTQPVDEDWYNLPFAELCRLFLDDESRLLIGIKRKGRRMVRPSPQLKLEAGDLLLMVSNASSVSDQ